ncbi:hypothetical protein [Streptococcus cristatus]|uniref:hypothetical protein n=1 Tax=Streptococcus cristatus TaxID=45634 RepID=UPI0007854E3A|nr:hypothetical protein [Streptococcus cristatus]
MKKKDNINLAEKISEISKKIEEVKITCFYMLSTDLYKIENNKLTEIITKKFENHPATIMELRATKDNQLFIKKHDSWRIPKELQHLKSKVDDKTNYYLNLYFEKLEKEKQNCLYSSKSNPFVKFVFTPLIEIDGEDELHFFFVTLTIFQNGSIIIELFEDLRSSFYTIDFLHPYTIMKAQIFPDFKKKNRIYSLNSDYQVDDILKYIKKELSSINGGLKLTESTFILHFITNMDQMNKMEFFKKDKLYTWMINAPYSPKNVSSKNRSKNYLTNYFDLDSINYINKGANYIVWNNGNSNNFESNFLKQASFFLSSATPFFQLVCLDETIMDGLEKFQLSNDKQLIKFNEWIHNYKRSSLFIYRINHRAVFDLFTHLQENSYFKHDEYIEKIKQEEFALLKDRNQFNDLQKNKMMEIILFLVGSVSVLEVVDIFTDNIKILSISALITVSLSIGVIVYRNRK